jgi:hypothetical protein
MAIAIKAKQRLLYMIKVQRWSIRTNPTANDLVIKYYLLSIMYRVKKSELQIWSLQIFSFQRNSKSQLQPPYFELYK